MKLMAKLLAICFTLGLLTLVVAQNPGNYTRHSGRVNQKGGSSRGNAAFPRTRQNAREIERAREEAARQEEARQEEARQEAAREEEARQDAAIEAGRQEVTEEYRQMVQAQRNRRSNHWDARDGA